MSDLTEGVALSDAEWDDLRSENMYDIEESVRRFVDRIIAERAAKALRDAAERVRAFRDWYPTSVFPSLDEALADDYVPTREQIAASSYRHAYGELVPRNLRAWADEMLEEDDDA